MSQDLEVGNRVTVAMDHCGRWSRVRKQIALNALHSIDAEGSWEAGHEAKSDMTFFSPTEEQARRLVQRWLPTWQEDWATDTAVVIADDSFYYYAVVKWVEGYGLIRCPR